MDITITIADEAALAVDAYLRTLMVSVTIDGEVKYVQRYPNGLKDIFTETLVTAAKDFRPALENMESAKALKAQIDSLTKDYNNLLQPTVAVK